MYMIVKPKRDQGINIMHFWSSSDWKRNHLEEERNGKYAVIYNLMMKFEL